MKYWLMAHTGSLGRAAIRLGSDRKGVTMLEYGLLAALIAGVCVTAVTAIGTNINTKFTEIGASI